jgi:hypothetical protein
MMLKNKAHSLIMILVMALACSDLYAQKRIRFPRGASSATVSGRIEAGGKRTFIVKATAGQKLTANVSSSDGEVTFDVGEVVMEFTTVAGDNFITIKNPREGALSRYALTVSIR